MMAGLANRDIGEPRRRVARGSVLSVAFGCVVDLAASVVSAIGFLVAQFLVGGVSRTPSGEYAVGLLDHWVGLVVGVACTILGANVAAHMAQRRPVMHGALVGLMAIGFGAALELLDPSSTSPVRATVLGFASVVPAGAFGGWLAKNHDVAA